MAQEDMIEEEDSSNYKRGVFLRENGTKVAKTDGNNLNSLEDFGSAQVTI